MILPPATLGLLGGGQLGRYFITAAHELGYRVMVIDPDHDSPAGLIADEHLVLGYDDLSALDRMAATCAAVTTEFENVPAHALAHLARRVPVRPSAEAVAMCQNRSAEKGFLKQHGFPHAPFEDIQAERDIELADIALFPAILKLANFGYDGKGQTCVRDRGDAMAVFRQHMGRPCILERMLPLDYEISVVLARDELGKTKCFPASENKHRCGILDVSIAPTKDANHLASYAEDIAKEIARKLDYIGTLSVEFFVVADQLYVNEMAPRPHNSGHYTLNACATSQFEQQVRALCGLPLGETEAHCAAVMVNLLGDLWYKDGPSCAIEPDWSQLLSVPYLKLHLYGKHEARPGRKMGHFTVLDRNPEVALTTAMAARTALGIGNK